MSRKKGLAAALAEINERIDADDILSAEDKAQIKDKAREHVAKSRKASAEEKYLKQAIRDEERRFNPAEQFEFVQIDLAAYVPFISLDGVLYFHGLMYELPYTVARTIADISARTWEHQNEINGHRRKGDINRRPMERRISPSDQGVRAPSAVNTRQSVLSSDTSI